MKYLPFSQRLLAALLLMLPFSLMAEGISFQKDNFQAALDKAKAADKLVFVDAMTDWCGPCKWMAKEVFTDEKVSAFYNEHFINLKVDMEKGEGPGLAKRYEVNAYPSLMFIDGEGDLVTKVIGSRTVADFLALGERIVKGIEPLTELAAIFESGKYDRKWLFDYLMRLTDEGKDISAPVEVFRKDHMQGDELLKSDSWAIFERHFRRIDTPEFEYVMDNIDRFREAMGKATVDNKLGINYSQALFEAIQKDEFARYDSLRAVILDIGIENADKQMIGIDLMKFRKQLTPEGYALLVVGVVTSGKIDDPGSLNNFAWGFYETEDDPKMLALALEWVKRSLEAGKNYANMDTYGMLLFKTGEYKKAVAACNEAIELAKEEGVDASATEKAMAEWLEKE